MLTNSKTNKGLMWFLRKYGWCLWLGLILGEIGLTPTHVGWWIFVIPLILLIGVSKKQDVVDDKSNSSDVEKSSNWQQ